MKISIPVIQVLVAVLFIISGLIKANDPLGLAYKMEEYFELWSTAAVNKKGLISFFDFFHNQSLPLSIFMISLEIVTGVALLVGWKKRFILWLLLLLIIFFTFFTGYAYLSGKFTNCGCFGDCIPITPLMSFTKDIILLAMIAFLLAGQKYIQPLFSKRTRTIMLTGTLVFSLALQWYAFTYLPFVDCLPFQKGNNITEQMKSPPGSLPDSIAMRFIYEKGGKRYEFAPENLPADFNTYTYIDRIDKIVRKGNAVPPIQGFILKGVGDIDSASAILGMPRGVLIFSKHLKGDWMEDLKEMYGKISNTVPVFIITSTSMNTAANILSKNGINGLQVFTLDNVAVKTAARTEPTIYYLEKGTVIKKWSGKEFDEAANYILKNKFKIQ